MNANQKPTALQSEQLLATRQRLDVLNQQLADPAVLSDSDKLRQLSKEHAAVSHIVSAADALTSTWQQLVDLSQINDDPDLVELAAQELTSLQKQLKEQEDVLNELLFPADPLASRDAIVEIRAAAGGDEAGLFAGELYRMYLRYRSLLLSDLLVQ